MEGWRVEKWPLTDARHPLHQLSREVRCDVPPAARMWLTQEGVDAEHARLFPLLSWKGLGCSHEFVLPAPVLAAGLISSMTVEGVLKTRPDIQN